MAKVFNFVPRHEFDALKNLSEFMNFCKTELNVFGANLEWSNWKWPRAGNFTKIGVHNQTKEISDRLHDSFIDFAKAYFRYQQGISPTGTKNELKALRALEAALIQTSGDANISDISFVVLDVAAQKIREHYSAGAAYHGGRELERLAIFVSSKRLVGNDMSDWKSPINRKKDEINTGKIAKERREKKLPTEEALSALAEIFANNPQSPRDIFTSSIFAMTMCAPSRISEILEMPVDCEIEQRDSKGIMRYGWRFYSGKGYGADIKWIPTEMVSIAKEAVARIRSLTHEARILAEWIEKTPNKFYRHKDCPDVDENQLLTMEQVCMAMGWVCSNRKSCNSSMLNFNLENKDFKYSLSDLWKIVKTKQPESFPWLSKGKSIKYSNALFSMRRNQIHGNRGDSPVILWKLENNIFNNDLSPRESLNRDTHQSIFDRWGYKNQDGSSIKITSHCARHLLNTIAQRGGLSQQQIAKWSGRADPKQNRVYNHVTEHEMVARAEALDTSMTLFGPKGIVEANQPVSIQEFNTLEKTAVHVTEYGFCVHDFVMMPCEKYRDCLNCNEHVCIKGDQEKLSRIKINYALVNEQLEKCQKGIDEGIDGADVWYESNKNALEQMSKLISILESSDIEDGAQIKLCSDKSFSPLRRAIDSKLAVTSNASERLMLKNMKNLFGGGLG